MRVELPSGAVIEDIPEGTTREQIKQRAISAGLATAADFAPSPPQQEMYNPLDEMSGYEKFMAGAGKGINDVGRGIGQLFGKELDASNAKYDAALMDTGAGVAGNVAGQIGLAVGGGSVLRGAGALGSAVGAAKTGKTLTTAGTALAAPTTAKTALGSGAVLGAVQPVNEGQSRAGNAAFGAGASLAGHGIASGVGKLINPNTAKLSSAEKAAMQRLESRGVKLDALDLTQSKPLKTLESVFENIPWTAGKAGERATTRAEAYTRAALRTMGEDATQVTDNVLEAAQTRIGSQFDGLIQDSPIEPDAKFFGDLKALLTEYEKLAPSLKPEGGSGAISDFLSMEQAFKAGQKPQITPEVYQLNRSALNKKARGMKLNNPQGAAELGRIQSALDDLVERNLGGDKLSQWKDTRRQYRNFKIIEKAADSNQTTLATGHLRPQELARAVRQVGKEKIVRGKSELSALARDGAKFANLTADSGTAQRAMMQNLMTTGTMGGGYLAGINPAALVAGYGIPKLAQKAMYSGVGRKYLTDMPEINPLLGHIGRSTATRGVGPLLGAEY